MQHVLLAVLCLSLPLHADFHSQLQGGTVVPAGSLEEVVALRFPGAFCTGTVVGPEVIVTARHCARTGAVAKFTYRGQNYEATIQRSEAANGRHDLSAGRIHPPIASASPATIGGRLEPGTRLKLAGYGCTQPGIKYDGKLREGEAVVEQRSKLVFEVLARGQAHACSGDSGGPTFVEENGRRLIAAVIWGRAPLHSHLIDLSAKESTDFLQKYAQEQKVEICGVNKNC